MDCPGFPDAALLIVGHGSSANSDSAAPVREHAARLRQRGLFRSVHEAFWRQEPFVTGVRTRITAPRVFILPFFISEGYFSEEVIPRALGFEPGPDWRRTRSEKGQTWVYCRAVGTHESMTHVLLARARQAVEEAPFPRAPSPRETTLFIAGHGTGQNENSRKAIERQVNLIASLQLYAAVHPCFIEEAPLISGCYQLAQTRSVVLVPFFTSDGLHVREDIPVLLGEPADRVREQLKNGRPTWRNPTERWGKRIWCARSVGSEPLLAEVILQRVQEAARWLEDEPQAQPLASH
jgi:sirohydrochlorin cobaltochelatase